MSGGIGLTLPVTNEEVAPYIGVKAWTFHPSIFSTWQAPSTGRIEGVLAVFRAGDVITNLHCVTNAAASGITSAEMGIASTSGATIYASTGDIKASLTATTYVTAALSATWTVPTTGVYYICFTHVNGGGTSPTLHRGGGWPSAVGSPKTASKSSETGVTDLVAFTAATGDYHYFFAAS